MLLVMDVVQLQSFLNIRNCNEISSLKIKHPDPVVIFQSRPIALSCSLRAWGVEAWVGKTVFTLVALPVSGERV